MTDVDILQKKNKRGSALWWTDSVMATAFELVKKIQKCFA